MAKQHQRNNLEIEGGCRLAEVDTAGGLPSGVGAGVGDGYKWVHHWMARSGVPVPPCRDGTAQTGELDRLGRGLQRGRGLGLFDDIWPNWVHRGSIYEMTPVNFKGSKSDPYGNRDLTSGKWDAEAEWAEEGTPLAAFLAAVEIGIPIWVCLLTEIDGTLMMRRVDAGKVWREGQDLTTGKGKPVCFLRPFGSGKYKGRYRRVRIEWRHVPAHMWLDADWTPFDATASFPPSWQR